MDRQVRTTVLTKMVISRLWLECRSTFRATNNIKSVGPSIVRSALLLHLSRYFLHYVGPTTMVVMPKATIRFET